MTYHVPMVKGMNRNSALHKTLEWLECNIRVPLEGSLFDIYVASPAKTVYVKLSGLDKNC